MLTHAALGVGASAAAVKKAYGKDISAKESTAGELVVGDRLQQVYFGLKGGKVASIFIGRR